MNRCRPMAVVCVLSVGIALPGLSQNIPAVVPAPSYSGFSLPSLGGSLHYAVTASETVTLGYDGTNNDVSATSISGDLAYLSVSQLYPFSLVYAGGYSAGTSDISSSTFHSLSISQVLTFGRWSFVAADSVRYLPQAPVAGLSGIPGLGDLGVNPVETGPDEGQGVLNNYGAQVSNTISGTASRRLGGTNSLSGSGSWSIQRFVGDQDAQGIDNNSATGSAVLGHRISPLASLSTIYSYSKSTYPDALTAFTSQTVSVEYSRKWTRKLSTDVSIGPERTTGSFDPTYTLAINASTSYSGKGYGASAAYVQSTNSGSGVTTGAKSNSATASVNRKLGPIWNSSASFAYTRTNALPSPTEAAFSSQTITASGQLNRQIGQKLSIYASYTAERQLLGDSTPQLGAFAGFSQILGFGVTYAPRSVKFDH